MNKFIKFYRNSKVGQKMCFSVFLLLKNARKFIKTQLSKESKLCSIKKSNAKTQNNLN
jgi:hypothetical protein